MIRRDCIQVLAVAILVLASCGCGFSGNVADRDDGGADDPGVWDGAVQDLPPGIICQPGESVCDGSVLRTCAASGQEWTPWDCATDGLLCQDDKCASKPVSCVKVRPIEIRTNEPVPASVGVVLAVDDCDGAPVIGLTLDRFRVYEDEKSISPTESSSTILDRGAEIYLSLVIDNSPSVRAGEALPKAVAAAKSYVEQVMVSSSVYAGVWFFSKSLSSRQTFTTDKAAVLAALDGLLTDETGSNTTNLYGALIDILDESAQFQKQQRDAMAGGITTLGQVLLFTDGSDQAALKSLDDAKAALADTTDDVLAIALGGEIEPDVISVLGKDGWFIAQTAGDLAAQFEDAARRTKGLQQRIYVLGYCSPKLAGDHELKIQVVSGGQVLGTSTPVPFNADRFDTTGAACSPSTFQQACDGKACGGLLCGTCGPDAECQSFECRCISDPRRAPPECTACLARFQGPDCGECSVRFTGVDCTECAEFLFGGPDCDQCALVGFALPDCLTCLPGLSGVFCDQCEANPRMAPPGCTTCLPLFQGADCSQCADSRCSGVNCDEGLKCRPMVTVPAGAFWQGCNEAVDDDCEESEYPYHQVTVPAFEIDKYEVTVEEYGNCVSASGCTASTDTSKYCNQGKSGKSAHPMNCIDWVQAREYCAWAGKRLCSESEWEKASRGTDGRKFPWGNEDATCDYAVMDAGGDGCGTESTSQVGSKPAGASPYGALDLSGNVAEWVEDEFCSYDEAPTDGSAWVKDPLVTSYMVVRGGCFFDFGDLYLRSSSRLDYFSATGYDYVGVRCCRSK